MDIAQLLAFSVKNGASDLHLSAGLPPMIRVDGDVRRINVDPMDHESVHGMVYDIMNDKQRKTYEEYWETDFSFEIPGLARFRVNAFNHNRGAGAVFRTIPSKILTLEELGAPKIFEEISDTPRGMVLVTGPTGSGKSTTLAGMVNYVNENHYGHILTVEDPIEFVHESKKCLINQREVHREFWSVRCVTLKLFVWRCQPQKPGIWCLVPCIPVRLQKPLTVLLMCFRRQKKRWFVPCCQNRCAQLFHKHCLKKLVVVVLLHMKL